MSSIVTKLNRLLFNTTNGEHYVTFFYATFDEATQLLTQMKTNDLLFLYTDGLSEALNVEGEEFGTSRIMDTLKSIKTLSADQIRDVVVRRVKEWCSGMSLYDDLTFVVMKVK